jgi:arylsulfatase A-like enzyme
MQKCNTFLRLKYSKVKSMLFVLNLLILSLTVGSCSSGDLKDPNIILISIDDLRADHLGCYGYSRDTSPNIDSFARNNIIFTKCSVHQAWTLTSHISMLTSLYPITHGVDMRHSLDSAIVTLAEILKNENYITMGFASGGAWTDAKYGFSRGFKIYYSGKPEESAEDKSTLIREHLETHKGEKLFLFLHYFDVHSGFNKFPYDAPPPFNNLFSQEYHGDFQGGVSTTFASEYLKYVNKHHLALEKKDLDYIISLYDNGIAYMDKCIGDLFEMLKSMDLFDNSLIIITADHGEEFQEHGYMLHSNPYDYEEIMHVPLVVKLPNAGDDFKSRKRGNAIDGLVESIDIMPTILDLLEIKGPKMQGKSLMDLMGGNEKGKEYVFGFGSNGSVFIRSERWKMLNDSGLKEGRFKLFDLNSDPMEGVNLISKGLEIEKILKEKLKERMELSQKLRKELLSEKSVPPDIKGNHKDVSLTEEEKEKLRTLGYLQ